MEIKYNNKTYNKIKELLADTTIANIDKFLFDNEKITLADFVNLQEQENKNDASGSASNSGDCGSASNSGDWGISVSNAIFGTVSNKAGLYSMVIEFVFDNLIDGEGLPKEKIIKQNAKLIKFTKEMKGKYYTLLKNKIFEVVECDGIKMIVTDRKDINGFKVLKGIIFGDYTIYNKQRKLEDIDKTFVVEKDGIFSHADTIDKAIADFRYKIANRDTSDFEYFKTTKDKISTDEIIKGYRVITGSCEFGTKHFVEDIMGDELKDSYTIDEALAILKTKNAYAFEKFENFVRGN